MTPSGSIASFVSSFNPLFLSCFAMMGPSCVSFSSHGLHLLQRLLQILHQPSFFAHCLHFLELPASQYVSISMSTRIYKASTSDLVKYNSASDSGQLQLREHNHPLAIGGEFPSTFPAGIVSVAQTVILTYFQPSFQMSNFFVWADTFLIRFIWFCFRSHSMHCIIVCFHK